MATKIKLQLVNMLDIEHQYKRYLKHKLPKEIWEFEFPMPKMIGSIPMGSQAKFITWSQDVFNNEVYPVISKAIKEWDKIFKKIGRFDRPSNLDFYSDNTIYVGGAIDVYFI